jgi:hypothetical protein
MAERKPLFMSSEGYSEEMATTDTAAFGGLTLGGNIAMGTHKITGMGDPGDPQDAATKAYVDALVQSIVIKLPVKGLSDANIATLSGLTTTVDTTVDLDTDGDRVILTAQDTAAQNGIWLVHTGAWTRPADFAAGSHAAGAFTFVEKGTLYADTGWVCSTDAPGDVVGTDDLAFVQFSAAGQIQAGSGLSKTGNTLSVKKGDGIEITSNTNAVNIDLATNPGLQLTGTSPSKKLAALVSSGGGVEIDGSNGLAIKLNGTTLQTSSSGASVKGVPSSFEINGTPTTYGTPGTGQVTAGNLDTLTAGSASNADSLHTHAVLSAPYTGRVENALAVAEAVAAGDPVYQTTTSDQVGKATANSDAKSRVLGVTRTGQSTPGNTAAIVSAGPCASVLTGATAGTAYYLAAAGGISSSLPGAGNRVIQVGVAKNSTDLFVRIVDYGKKAA